ncbi:MAG: 4-alpha-glucanotransferase [Frankiaceae bacterium]|nr:4-alpha-glucanotransferase [Frankiaceae bacterium]
MDPGLQSLAEAFGVATEYEDWRRRPVSVPEDTVRRVLTGLGVDVDDPDRAVADAEAHQHGRLVPPTVIVVADRGTSVELSVPEGEDPSVELILESGQAQPLGPVVEGVETVAVDGHRRKLFSVVLLADLPLGYHRLRVTAGLEAGTAVVAVVPSAVPRSSDKQRLWGWMVQLYAVRSAGSWGIGDYADLAELARWSGAEQQAGVLLVNPLHAFAPGGPVQDSPYYPASRRFSSPLYLRPELLGEYGEAADDVRRQIDALAAGFEAGGDADTRIDRDAIWEAKRQALELLFEVQVERPDAEQSRGLTDFATWCALAERHGPDWHEWPEKLRDPRSPAVDEARDELADRIAFHAWLQRCCTEQLAAAQQAATDAGMPVGIVHDLAVGVDPGGPDAWALQADLAVGFTVGAPPDAFNQQGQDWRLPPWRPDRLAETGYAPLRDMISAVLEKGGGLRVDHVLGLFRLWWVPEGLSAADGTYITYDAAAMLGILALEAARADAVVVGEDLGTVPDHVRADLAEAGVLGSSVLWFEKDPDDETPLPPGEWRELTMASVTTHDLPTVAGWWQDEQVRVRSELGLLTVPFEQEQANAAAEKTALLASARREGLLPAGNNANDDAELDVEQVSLALHGMLGRSPARFVLAAPGDAVGDVRQPNLPGTVDEYPNWRLPIADAEGRPVSLEQLQADPRVERLAQLLAKEVGR